MFKNTTREKMNKKWHHSRLILMVFLMSMADSLYCNPEPHDGQNKKYGIVDRCYAGGENLLDRAKGVALSAIAPMYDRVNFDDMSTWRSRVDLALGCAIGCAVGVLGMFIIQSFERAKQEELAWATQEDLDRATQEELEQKRQQEIQLDKKKYLALFGELLYEYTENMRYYRCLIDFLLRYQQIDRALVASSWRALRISNALQQEFPKWIKKNIELENDDDETIDPLQKWKTAAEKWGTEMKTLETEFKVNSHNLYAQLRAIFRSLQTLQNGRDVFSALEFDSTDDE